MDLKQLRETAGKRLQGFCRVCPACDGRACAGEVPGMGGVGSGSAFSANIKALASVRLNIRTIHGAKDPCTCTQIFGKRLKTPILAAPITGTAFNMGGAVAEEDFIRMIISGSRSAGSLGFSGDSAGDVIYGAGIEAIRAEEGHGAAIIKPRGQKEIVRRMRSAEDAGAVAVGVDIDGAGLVTMSLKGHPVGPKSESELKELVSGTRLPFIIKGIMTVDEAVKAAGTGAAAIVVSNHGGRILDHVPGAASVLPDISEAVGDRLLVLVDGGIRSGVDVLKYLALGAHGVLVGRPLVVGAFGGGSEGVRFIIKTMTDELKQAMVLTGCGTIGEINRRVLFQPGIECY